jgi:hypothetical protein
MSISYAREKLVAAVSGMASSEFSRQKRLEHAFMTFSPLKPEEHFPAGEIRESYLAIYGKLTADHSDPHRGYGPTTISNLSDLEAAAIIDDLFSLMIDLVEAEKRVED